MSSQSKQSHKAPRGRFLSLGAFFIFRPFGKNNARRPEGPTAIIYSGIVYDAT